MKKTLILAGLLAFPLAGVALADRGPEHAGRTPMLRHDGYQQHRALHDSDRRRASRSHERRHDRHRHQQRHDHHRHEVVWHRHYVRPRLYIRLPWLIYID